MTRPAITVLMPVHNGIDYVESALRSVMEQSFRDIEILVIDDCSSDGTAALLDQLAAEDPRIRVEHLSQNLRLPGALNHGLALARAPLVARMDADDLCHPRRLEIQKAFMDAHPEIDMVGASIEKIDETGKRKQFEHRPYDADQTRWLCLLVMPLIHPTLMFRLPGPAGMEMRYDPTWTASEDYDFTARLTEVGRAACLQEVLLKYRVHDGSITGKKIDLQNEEAANLARRTLAADLPAHVVPRLEPLLDAIYGDRETLFNIFKVFQSLRVLIRETSRDKPHLRPWMREQAAEFVQHAFRLRKRSDRRIRGSFWMAGPDFVLARRRRQSWVEATRAPYMATEDWYD